MKRRFSIVLVVAMIQLVCVSTSFADPIHDAAEAGNLVQVARLIAEDRANLEARDQDAWTPLHLAQLNGYATTVTALLAEAIAQVHTQTANEYTRSRKWLE